MDFLTQKHDVESSGDLSTRNLVRWPRVAWHRFWLFLLLTIFASSLADTGLAAAWVGIFQQSNDTGIEHSLPTAALQEADSEETLSPKQLAFFESKVRPVLIKHCYECHSQALETEGDLSLDTRSGSRQGGQRGPAVVPGDLDASLLIKAVRYRDANLQMPPDQALPTDVIADLETWIRMGAPDPRNESPQESTVKHSYEVDWEAGRRHWAFQPIQNPVPPEVEDNQWVSNDIDRFILAELEDRGLKPAEEADPAVLLRRLCFDLNGLPPTVQQLETLNQGDKAAALDQVTQQLLQSPAYGEKWARHWLDVARYAESTGGTVNFYYPQAWRYRDYVIASFNNDKPYDQFVREQLAGDLLENADPNQQAEQMIATGFLAMGVKSLNERSGLKFELDMVDEQIDVTTQAFLGMTVACARCHDHKFDPIAQRDYYSLAGIFRSTETCYGTVSFINAQRVSPLLSLPEAADVTVAADELSARQRERLERQIEDTKASMRQSRDGLQNFFAMGRVSLLQAQLDAYDDQGQPLHLAMGVREKPSRSRRGGFGRRFGDYTFDGSQAISDSPLYVRGESDQPSEESVPRGTLQILSNKPLEIPTGSGRLQLADWIASAENPLTARVIVNRVWLQLFGQGLVPTVDDFGMAGQPPTHPELLDHLANRLIQDQWSLKRLVSYIVSSRTYRMSGAWQMAAAEVDPRNQWYWRMKPRRLDAEAIRDAMLLVSGRLESEPPVGSAVGKAGEGPVSRAFMRRDPVLSAIDSPDDRHRSIYLPMIRDQAPEALSIFDAADPSLITPVRVQTTVPSQSLYLLNNDFVLKCSDSMAEQLADLPSDDERVNQSYLLCFGRLPVAGELEKALEFVQAYQVPLAEESQRVPLRGRKRQQMQAWSAYCQALMGSAEFQYRR